MTKAEFKKAFAIAQSEKDLSGVDDAIVYGCGLPEFKTVYVTLDVVAKLIRWQCQYIFGDGWDMEELNNIAYIARKKFLIVGY